MNRSFHVRVGGGLLAWVSLLAAAPNPAITDETKVPPYTLPDPLVCADGTPVRTVATWESKRRPELLGFLPAKSTDARRPIGPPRCGSR
jgi:hypothetical protein